MFAPDDVIPDADTPLITNAGVVADAGDDGGETLPAASLAVTVYVCALRGQARVPEARRRGRVPACTPSRKTV